MPPSTRPSTTSSDEALLGDAVEAARRAGKILRTMFRARPEGRVKTSLRDLVTEADLAAERAVLDYVESHHPDHGWQSEEAGRQERSSSPFLWVVDPLDGTSNFAHGFPHFCVSIALLCDGRSRVAAIYDPMREELFTAVAGGGARRNGRRIRVSAVETLDRAMVTTGFPYEPPEQRSAAANLTARAIERVQMLRRSGSAALDLAYVAAGRLEAHWEFNLSLHDIAAGVLLVAEAGGRVDELHLTGWRTGYLASNGLALHDAVLDLHRQFLGSVEARAVSLIGEGETNRR
jgi:myo-inositol-1(or 4)-monophosphatase